MCLLEIEDPTPLRCQCRYIILLGVAPFVRILLQMRSSGVHMVLVFYHSPSASVVGSATLLLEHKFIHTTATRGRIEDVIVHPNHQVGYFNTTFLLVGEWTCKSPADGNKSLSLPKSICSQEVVSSYLGMDLSA